MLRVTRDAVARLEKAWRVALPFEACGVLLGSKDAAGAVASDVVEARSVLARGAFEIPDLEMRRFAVLAEGRGLEIVALFHSHPSDSLELSEADRAALRHAPWPWVVVARGRISSEAVALAAYAPGQGAPIPISIGSGTKSADGDRC
jgi:proteasome lid subunit RPN8/RPN11